MSCLLLVVTGEGPQYRPSATVDWWHGRLLTQEVDSSPAPPTGVCTRASPTIWHTHQAASTSNHFWVSPPAATTVVVVSCCAVQHVGIAHPCLRIYYWFSRSLFTPVHACYHGGGEPIFSDAPAQLRSSNINSTTAAVDTSPNSSFTEERFVFHTFYRRLVRQTSLM